VIFCNVIQHARDSSPGIDGIPYSGRKYQDFNQSIGTLLLEDVFAAMRAHCPASPCPDLHGFDTLIQCCIPKNINFPQGNGIACRSSETRSLPCKNTSNKHMCTTVARAISPIVQSAATANQRGFFLAGISLTIFL